MSRYALPADLAQLGLPATALTGVSADDQQAALDSASGVTDGYLAARFNLPLVAPFPPDLVQAVCSIAAYTLLSRRGYNPEAGSDQNVRLRYEDAMKWCRDVSDNRAHPQVTQAASVLGAPLPPRIISKCPRGW